MPPARVSHCGSTLVKYRWSRHKNTQTKAKIVRGAMKAANKIRTKQQIAKNLKQGKKALIKRSAKTIQERMKQKARKPATVGGVKTRAQLMRQAAMQKAM